VKIKVNWCINKSIWDNFIHISILTARTKSNVYQKEKEKIL
jgi:hypothetical protein